MSTPERRHEQRALQGQPTARGDVCAGNAHGTDHQWHRDGTYVDLNGRRYWIFGCQLCGASRRGTRYVEDER